MREGQGQLLRTSQNEFPPGKRKEWCCQRKAFGQTNLADDAQGCSDFQSLRSVPPAAGGAYASCSEKLQE